MTAARTMGKRRSRRCFLRHSPSSTHHNPPQWRLNATLRRARATAGVVLGTETGCQGALATPTGRLTGTAAGFG
jgi:hypothetical protein